jgi:hypothetical protein
MLGKGANDFILLQQTPILKNPNFHKILSNHKVVLMK